MSGETNQTQGFILSILSVKLDGTTAHMTSSTMTVGILLSHPATRLPNSQYGIHLKKGDTTAPELLNCMGTYCTERVGQLHDC